MLRAKTIQPSQMVKISERAWRAEGSRMFIEPRRQPFNRSRPASAEESLAALVRRRLGQDLVDYALNPLVAGIYAGDPEQLSSIHSMHFSRLIFFVP